MKFLRKEKGFTLIELLVVISIIGVLSTIVLSSLNSARTQALDATRKSDLDQIRKAITSYALDNNLPFTLENSGCGGGTGGDGLGWFDGNYGAVNGSTKDCLVDGGYLPEEISDPLRNTSFPVNDSSRYMTYVCSGTMILMANLKSEPSPPADTVCTTYDTWYGMDYFVEVR